METQRITHSKTGLSYESFVAENGLTVICWPMAGYRSVHAVYATNFGSVDRDFTLNGEKYFTPAGVAHFLEHKMFENENGQDAFELYAKTGASANAFTSFDKTCYLFTATENVNESLDILLSFVSKPYFTKQTVAKEQGIIAQEIKMYDDSHAWRLLFALLGIMYHQSPVKDDIAGTVESIGEITPELLYKCTEAFYNPHNMVLAVAGGITAEEVNAAVTRAGFVKKAAPTVERIIKPEPITLKEKAVSFAMPVSQPVLGIGFKIAPPQKNMRLKEETVADMITTLLVGDTTPLYRSLYDEGLIAPGFGGEVLAGEGYFAIIFSGEVNKPQEVSERIKAEITRLQKTGVDEELFTACKNSFYGEAITELESVDDVATGLASAHMQNHSYFEEIDVIAGITKKDIDNAICSWFNEEQMAIATIVPQEAENG